MVAPDTTRQSVDAHEQFTFLAGLLDTFGEPAVLTAGTGPFGQPAILYANRAAEEHLDRSFDRLVGQPVEAATQPDHRAALAGMGFDDRIDVSDWEMAPLFDPGGACRYRVFIKTQPAPQHAPRR